MVVIVIDNREHNLYDKLTEYIRIDPKEGISMKTEVLPLGDILIQTNEGNVQVLIERKSLTDLLASIKDGRYEEQSYRLRHASGIPSHNIIYLIEGVFSTISLKDKRTVLSAMTSIHFFKGFSILRSSSIAETAEMVYCMADKIQRSIAKGLRPAFFNMEKDEAKVMEKDEAKVMEKDEAKSETIETIETTEETHSYSSFVKKVKKENITATNIGEIMLCQIPGIQSKYATAVLLHFGSFSKMIEGLKEGKADFSGITYECNGKKRKIPKSCGESIVLYLQNL